MGNDVSWLRVKALRYSMGVFVPAAVLPISDKQAEFPLPIFHRSLACRAFC